VLCTGLLAFCAAGSGCSDDVTIGSHDPAAQQDNSDPAPHPEPTAAPAEQDPVASVDPVPVTGTPAADDDDSVDGGHEDEFSVPDGSPDVESDDDSSEVPDPIESDDDSEVDSSATDDDIQVEEPPDESDPSDPVEPEGELRDAGATDSSGPG
jgi:hypothetical protein